MALEAGQKPWHRLSASPAITRRARNRAAANPFALVTPMSLSIEDVHRIAHLARIAISDAEAADVQAKLAGIFGLIDDMQRVDTRGVEPMSHAEEIASPLREDIVTEPDLHELYQRGAPQVEHGLYLVPRVID